jgi:quercetin dioxygenase-like cupin family protein
MTPETLLDMASGLALVAEARMYFLERNPDARTGLRILATDSYDVWLLWWPAGTAVSPHHHGDSDAALVVSSGALKETHWLDGRREERRLTRGQGATVERGVVHDVEAEVDALSVHVYSPPLARMAFFDDQGENLLLEEPVDPSHDVVTMSGFSIVPMSCAIQLMSPHRVKNATLPRLTTEGRRPRCQTVAWSFRLVVAEQPSLRFIAIPEPPGAWRRARPRSTDPDPPKRAGRPVRRSS